MRTRCGKPSTPDSRACSFAVPSILAICSTDTVLLGSKVEVPFGKSLLCRHRCSKHVLLPSGRLNGWHQAFLQRLGKIACSVKHMPPCIRPSICISWSHPSSHSSGRAQGVCQAEARTSTVGILRSCRASLLQVGARALQCPQLGLPGTLASEQGAGVRLAGGVCVSAYL